MTRKSKKRLFLIFKILLAALLLWFVLGQAHLDDYVSIRKEYGGGESCVRYGSTRADSDTICIEQGFLWWKEHREIPLEHLIPAYEDSEGCHYIRPGILTSLSNMNIGLFILAALGFPLSLLVIAFRLKFLLGFQEIRISIWDSVKLTFLGQFFNTVVPGVVGGDLVKAWYLISPERSAGVVVVTVFIDRLLGLCELVLLAGIMVAAVLVLGSETVERMRTAIIAVATLVGAISVVLLLLFNRSLRKTLRVDKLYRRTSLAHHFAAAGEAAIVFRNKPLVLLGGLIITVLGHLFFIGGIVFVGLALSIDVRWYSYLVYIPLIYIIGSVPITPGGVGLIENLYLGFLAGATISDSPDLSAIIAMAILVRFLITCSGLPGLIMVLTGRKLPDQDQMEEDIQYAEEKEAAKVE